MQMNVYNSKNFIVKPKRIFREFSLFKGLVLGFLCVVISANASANPGYKVFFDGGGFDASSIVGFGGAPEVPEGVCGMRVSAAALLYDFYWAEYNEFVLGSPMQEPPFGPPSSATYEFPEVALEAVIEFTGPLGNNCESEWVFHLPLTGDWPTWANGTPQGGGALVFNVLPNEIEWLNSGFQVWEPPGGGPGDLDEPNFVTICEGFPDLCIEPGYAYDSPCNSSIIRDLCDDYTALDKISLGGERLVRIAITELASASITQYRNKFQKAQAAFFLALEKSKSLKNISQRIEDSNLRDAESRNKLSLSIGITEITLRSCLQSVAEKIENRSSSTLLLTDEANMLVKQCGFALESLRSVRDDIRYQ